MVELPMLAQRALTYGVKIYPYMMFGVFDQYERKKIPDKTLSKMSEDDLDKYVRALYKCSCFEASEWSVGHRMLEELGFSKVERKERHRTFISLVWTKEENHND